MKEKILRSFNLTEVTINENSDNNVVEGYAATFNSKTNIADIFEEQIDSRAFDSCIFDDACLLVNHDISRLALARCRRNTDNSTLQISTDSKGLKIRATLDVDNNTEARNLYSAIKRGDVNGMSFMFNVESDTWRDLDKNLPVRTITKISRVFEVSAVNFPAYSDTEIYARSDASLVNEKMALENAKAEALENEKLNLETERQKLLFKIKN